MSDEFMDNLSKNKEDEVLKFITNFGVNKFYDKLGCVFLIL